MWIEQIIEGFLITVSINSKDYKLFACDSDHVKIFLDFYKENRETLTAHDLYVVSDKLN